MNDLVGQGRLPGRDDPQAKLSCSSRTWENEGGKVFKAETRTCDVHGELQVVRYCWSRSGILGDKNRVKRG